MVYIGLDIGGTFIKYGLISEGGTVLVKDKIPTILNVNECVNSIVELCNKLISNSKDKVLGIGVGCPGIVDGNTGIVKYSCNLGWKNVNLKEMLESKLHLPVLVGNDANVATLGETKYGAGNGYKNVILLTLGTGVGGGVVVDGKLLAGNLGAGAELGHMVIESNGAKCSCGLNGCLECYASAKAFLNNVKLHMQKDSSSLLWEECEGDINKINILSPFKLSNDKCANFVIKNYIKYLSIGLLNYCNIFRPEVIILGGGMSAIGEELINKITNYLKANNYGYKHAPVVEIKLAKLQNDAGILGARALFLGE